MSIISSGIDKCSLSWKILGQKQTSRINWQTIVVMIIGSGIICRSDIRDKKREREREAYSPSKSSERPSAITHLHSAIKHSAWSINSNEASENYGRLRVLAMQRTDADKALPSAFLTLSDASARQQVWEERHTTCWLTAHLASSRVTEESESRFLPLHTSVHAAFLGARCHGVTSTPETPAKSYVAPSCRRVFSTAKNPDRIDVLCELCGTKIANRKSTTDERRFLLFLTHNLLLLRSVLLFCEFYIKDVFDNL